MIRPRVLIHPPNHPTILKQLSLHLNPAATCKENITLLLYPTTSENGPQHPCTILTYPPTILHDTPPHNVSTHPSSPLHPLAHHRHRPSPTLGPPHPPHRPPRRATRSPEPAHRTHDARVSAARRESATLPADTDVERVECCGGGCDEDGGAV